MRPSDSPKTIRIHPKRVSGRFTRGRVTMVWLSQMVFLLLPWLSWNGRQAVLWDIEARRFEWFGQVFMARDLPLLASVLMVCALGLFWWTALFGRVWCGHACPQTIYTQIMQYLDFVFEGDRNARLKLAQEPWHAHKITRKLGKYTCIILFCFWTGLTFTAYFTPAKPLWLDLWQGDMTETAWMSTLLYATFTWLLAHVLREQVCLHMCPYARFQSVMVDQHTRLITYNVRRGEPRGTLKSNSDGDCIDCQACVHVCPTGIDIRHGLQMGCIACGACIDACDATMTRLKRPVNLIRYTAQSHRVDSPAKHTRFRLFVYAFVIFLLLTFMAHHLYHRHSLDVYVSTERQFLSRLNNQGQTQNTYIVRLNNPNQTALQVQIGLNHPNPDPIWQLHTASENLILNSQSQNKLIVHVTQIRPLPTHMPQEIQFEFKYRPPNEVRWHHIQKNAPFLESNHAK